MIAAALIRFALAGALAGTAGWAIEYAWEGRPRYSAVFAGVRVPFLPIYGFGAALVGLLANWPLLAGWPLIVRGIGYAIALTGPEWVGCQIDRALGACSWDYTGTKCLRHGAGCIDAGHSLAWGGLGLAAERVMMLVR